MPCKQVPDGWIDTIQPSDWRTKLCVAVSQLPFLVETSHRHGFLWTASARVDGANGPNLVSQPGLDVEKKRGEDAPPLTEKVTQLDHGRRNFWKCTFFDGESLVQVRYTWSQM